MTMEISERLREEQSCCVEVPRLVADAIDAELAPMDAIWLLEEIAVQLPVAHRPSRWASLGKWLGWTMTYQAESIWSRMTITYVEREGAFTVLAAESTPREMWGKALIRIGLPNVELRQVAGTHMGVEVADSRQEGPKTEGGDADGTNPSYCSDEEVVGDALCT